MKIYPRGKERVNRRLVPDHIVPGLGNDLENIRILCYACNDLRGPNLRTDLEVLVMMNVWYENRFPPHYLYWMNRPNY